MSLFILLYFIPQLNKFGISVTLGILYVFINRRIQKISLST